MPILSSAPVTLYHTLTWNLYSRSRLYALITINILLTIGFFHFFANSKEECKGAPRFVLSIGRFYYLIASIYLLLSLSQRLKIIDEETNNIDVSPAKKKLDYIDFVFLTGWLALNFGMMISFALRGECSTSSNFIVFYFICLMIMLLLLIMSFCCVGWFALAFTQSRERAQNTVSTASELSEYQKL